MRLVELRAVIARSLAAATVSAAALLVTVPTVAGQPSDPPVSGDDRATAHPGNIKDGDCAEAGLSGSAIEVGRAIVDGTYIDITSVPDGVELTGVVVKGSPAYNVYKPANVSEWTGLHAPLAGRSGKPAAISHWFACGIRTDTTTTTTTSESSTTTTTASSSESSSSSSQTTTTGSSSTETTPAPGMIGPGGGSSQSGGLALTGFAGGRTLLVTGVLLVLVGAGLVLAHRRRAFGRR